MSLIINQKGKHCKCWKKNTNLKKMYTFYSEGAHHGTVVDPLLSWWVFCWVPPTWDNQAGAIALSGLSCVPMACHAPVVVKPVFHLHIQDVQGSRGSDEKSRHWKWIKENLSGDKTSLVYIVKGLKKKLYFVLWTLFSLLFKCEVPIMFGILKIIVIFSSINFFKYVVIITHISPYHRHLERQKHCTHTWTQAMTKPIAWSMKGTNKKAIAFKYITADCQPAHIIQNAPVIQHETRAQRLRAFIHMGKY